MKALKAIMLATVLLVSSLPAWAGVAGPEGGQIIENLVFEHVVVQDITKVSRDVLNEHLAHIIGTGTVDDRTTGNFHHFNAEATVSDAEAAATLAALKSQIAAQVASIPGRGATYDVTDHSNDFSSSTVFLQPVVTSELTGTDFGTETSVGFEQSDDAIIIGDLADWPNIIVAQGTLTVTTTETTIETQHITETTTNPFNIVDTYTFHYHRVISPIVLNMNGTGRLEATGGEWLPRTKVDKTRMAFFDFNGNGFPVLMEWVGPNDGLLCRPKENGRIDGTSLFGTATGFESGYEALAVLDSNGDDAVSGSELDGLCVWQDKNSNAYPDAGEVRTVNELGITALSLKHDNFQGSFTMGGEQFKMFDWWPNALELKRLKQGKLLQANY